MIVAALMLMASSELTATSSPRPIGPPAAWFDASDYPASAIRAREEGAVRFALDVSATGAITACRIVESSGFADLDTQTCAIAIRRARFLPALDADGRAVASSFVQRTRWALPISASHDAVGPLGTAMSMASAMATVDVDTRGHVVRCTVTRATNTMIDPCAALPVGKAIVAPTIIDGRAVPATVSTVTLISVRPAAGPPIGFDTRP
jgi:TonB family protein